MKKNQLFCLLLIILSINASAQKYAYKKGDKLLNVGIGLNSYYDGGFPLNVSFESGVSKDISIGASIDYLSYQYNPSYFSSYNFTTTYFAARASYHVNELLKVKNKKVDLYAGLTIGFRRFSWRNDYYGRIYGNRYNSGTFLGAYVGGKYYFNKSVGAFVELGAVGSTNGRVGVAFKL